MLRLLSPLSHCSALPRPSIHSVLLNFYTGFYDSNEALVVDGLKIKVRRFFRVIGLRAHC